MRIIISPAKKMNVDTDSMAWKAFPQFLPRTEQLCGVLQGMDYDALKALWKCNDKIAAQNVERLQRMDLHRGLTPAILSYEGIQYQYMAPGVFSDQAFAYIQEHLRILSGFYGLLRPLDGITPYRLEMQARLAVGDARDLYAFWGDSLARQLFDETSCIINLASKEYSQCVSRYITPEIRFITCAFCEEKNGKLIEKGTMCKMARGEMVRYMAERQISDPEQITAFDRLNYRFSPEHSSQDTFTFIKQPGR